MRVSFIVAITFHGTRTGRSKRYKKINSQYTQKELPITIYDLNSNAFVSRLHTITDTILTMESNFAYHHLASVNVDLGNICNSISALNSFKEFRNVVQTNLICISSTYSLWKSADKCSYQIQVYNAIRFEVSSKNISYQKLLKCWKWKMVDFLCLSACDLSKERARTRARVCVTFLYDSCHAISLLL